MTKDQIVEKVKSLNLPDNSFVVFGSGPMAAVNIRDTNDIDMLVSSNIYKMLQDKGWKQIEKGPKDNPLIFDVFEIHENWDFSPYSPRLDELLKTADIVDTIPFASLVEVKKWKVATGGDKHLADVTLIDKFLKKT